MAGLKPAGVICEIMKDDGTMARVPDLIEFCNKHGLRMLTVAELIRYRLQTERYIHRIAEVMLPTQFADFRMISFKSDIDGVEMHTALVLGDVTKNEPTLVRVHSHCLHGDVFGSTLCNCRNLIDQSLRRIAQEGRGALVYLRKFGQDCHSTATAADGPSLGEGSENTERTLRQAGLGSQILSDLGIQKIRLLTNTPTHIPALRGFNLDIVDCVPLFSSDKMSIQIDTSREDHVLSAL
jgi:3,4-dihydroxy 2-butanone 4-phosphate synthase/GTP cyclohydrolase II